MLIVCYPLLALSVRGSTQVSSRISTDAPPALLSQQPPAMGYTHPPESHLLQSPSSQMQSPMSEQSYQEEPSPVPEPTLPEDFHFEEEDFHRDLAESGKVALDGNFVDHSEEMVTVVSQKLSQEEMPPKEVGFKVTLEDYTSSGLRTQAAGEEEEDEEEYEEEEQKVAVQPATEGTGV